MYRLIEINMIICFIKFLGVNFGLTISFLKIINQFDKQNIYKKIALGLINIVLSLIQSMLIDKIPTFFTITPIIVLYSMILAKMTNNEFSKSFIVCIASLAISYVASIVSIAISAALFPTFNKVKYIDYFTQVITTTLNIVFVLLLFKLKRFKNGFSFLSNEYLNMFVLLATIIVILAYILGANFSKAYLAYGLFIIIFIFFFILKQSFTIYQKQRNQLKTLKEYEKELAETKQKLQIAVEEKEKITKSNHEFYHRQEALKSKLNTLANSLYNTEFAEEISAISNRLNNLSDEYKHKTKVLPKLPLTGLDEIDDMISYFQTECDKNNIEFIFKLECNINNIVPKQIMKNELETLLGDLIRNSIIAINHNKSTNNSIMLVFGLTDKIYQIDVYDTGINFEIDTLLNLGINRCSTHLDDGGSGIGFITTFETLARTKSSLIINELNSTKYTKFISIKFDSLNKYIINSYRAGLINNMNVNNRDIIINNK